MCDSHQPLNGADSQTDWQRYLDTWDGKSPAQDSFNPEPKVHHPFCAYYRDGRDCSCFEGRFPSGPEGDAAIEAHH